MKSIDETLNNPFFRAYVDKIILGLKRQKILRPADKDFKRDWMDRLGDNFNPQFFFDNLKDVWEGNSNLNYEQRKVIDEICTNAFHKAKKIYDEKTELEIKFNKFERIRNFLDLLRRK